MDAILAKTYLCLAGHISGMIDCCLQKILLFLNCSVNRGNINKQVSGVFKEFNFL